MNLLGVVMAGGRNVRYGGLKAFATVDGERIADRVMRALRGVTSDLVVIANDAEAYEPLGLPIRSDEVAAGGALAGLLTALRWCTELGKDGVAVVACDMPFASPDLLREMKAMAESSDTDAVIPESGSRRGLEPLFALYSTSCIPAIERAIEREDMRMISFHDEVRVSRVPIDKVSTFGDPAMLFMNVNTPEELLEAQRIAGESSR